MTHTQQMTMMMMTNNEIINYHSYRPEIDKVASQPQNGKMPLDSVDEAGNVTCSGFVTR